MVNVKVETEKDLNLGIGTKDTEGYHHNKLSLDLGKLSKYSSIDRTPLIYMTTKYKIVEAKATHSTGGKKFSKLVKSMMFSGEFVCVVFSPKILERPKTE